MVHLRDYSSSGSTNNCNNNIINNSSNNGNNDDDFVQGSVQMAMIRQELLLLFH